MPTTFNSAHLADQLLQGFEDIEIQAKLVFALGTGNFDVYESLLISAKQFNVAWTLHGMQQQLFSSVFAEDENILGYLQQPTVQIHRRDLPIDGTFEEAYDIVTLPFRSIDLASLAVETEYSIRAGIWATLTEGAALQTVHNGEVHSAAESLRGSMQGTEPPLVLTTENASKLADIPTLSMQVQTAIKNDIANGFAVVIHPPTGPKAAEQIAWWRINPSTGETTGVIGTGEGGFLERLTVEAFGRAVAVAAAGISIVIIIFSACAFLVGFVWVATNFQTNTEAGLAECKKLGTLVGTGTVAIYALWQVAATSIFAALMALWAGYDFFSD